MYYARVVGNDRSSCFTWNTLEAVGRYNNAVRMIPCPEYLSQLDFSYLVDVRTTSVILLLGVGSFVCYKLYRQLKQRLRKKRPKKDPSLRSTHVRSWITNVDPRCPHDRYVESDDESEISETTHRDDTSDGASFGDADTNSSCGGLSDIEERWDMGVTSSNPYEPVRFDTHSGNIHFQGCQAPKAASTPLNIAARGVQAAVNHRARGSKLECHQTHQRNSGPKGPKAKPDVGSGDTRAFPNGRNNNNKNNDDQALVSDDSISHDPDGLLDSLSYEGNASSGAATPWAQDTQSLQANFSFGSLTERNRLTEELFSSVRALAEDEETDGFSPSGMVSDSAIPRLRGCRNLSVESEASDLSIFEQAPLQVPRETFDTIDRIETILHDTKQELLDLDADLVSLRVWQKLPQDHESSAAPGSDADAQRGDAVCTAGDSGSDFGNSLESDSERITKDSSAPSLEWDSACLPRHGVERRGSGVKDDDGMSTLSEVSDIEDTKSSGVFNAVRRHSGGSVRMPGSLRQEIQRAMRWESDRWKGRLVRSQTAPVDRTLPESEQTCEMSRSATHELFQLSDTFDRIPTVPEENTPSPSGTSASDFVSEFASLDASSLGDVASHDTNGNDIVQEHPGDDFELNGDSVVSIGDRVLIEDYIPERWHRQNNGATENVEKSLTGILSGLCVASMRRVRHDGYDAIRAAAFQVLASGGSLLSSHRGANAVFQRFHEPASLGKLPWLEQWRFHHKLGHDSAMSCLQQFWECLSCLQDMEDQVNAAANPELFLARHLNEDATLDAKLVEAVRIVMLKSALDLFALMRSDNDQPCPVFATVLFSRSSSATPKDLFLNHLNRLGREQQVQEVELYLLGYALATTLTVVRPALSGSEDCISRYPEWQVGTWPEVVLVEQDGQYCACAR